MAVHIDNVESSSIPKVGKDEFYATARTGDLIFCSGSVAISKAIEGETHSPFSHVLQLWLPQDAEVWLTLESTSEQGVHVGRFGNYVDGYKGSLVLARRPVLTPTDIINIRRNLLSVVGDAYDWKQEVYIAVHNIDKDAPIVIPPNEYYCSGYQYFGSLAANPALQRPGVNFPTPEDNWTDASVVPICTYTP